jgi:protein-disulfide isomerase
LQTLPSIQQNYEGQVRFVIRNFPVHGDPATKAAEASLCANDQGKFWEYEANLWDTYDANLAQAQVGTDALVTTLKGYASDLGLDTATFNDCLDSDKYLSQVQKDAQDAQSYGVTGTPCFFINGRQVTGAIPFADYQDSSGATKPGFQSLIDQALATAQAGSAVPTILTGTGG